MTNIKGKVELDECIQPGSFGKVPIELIEIHPILLDFFNLEALKYLSRHPFSESIMRAAVEVSKLPVIHKTGKSKVKKYLLTGNLNIYFSALALTSDLTRSLVTVVVDQNLSQETIINNVIHQTFVPIKSPISCAILAAIHKKVECKKKERGFRYSIAAYESSPANLEKHGHIKDLTGFDRRAWDKVAGKEALPTELLSFIEEVLRARGTKKTASNSEGAIRED